MSQVDLHNLPDPGMLTDATIYLALSHVNAAKPDEDKVASYVWKIILCDTDEVVGEIRLRVGLSEVIELYGGQVGYHVLEQFRGNGYASKALKLLKAVARLNHMDEILIACAPDNLASQKTVENAGGTFSVCNKAPEDHPVRLEYGVDEVYMYAIDVD